MRSPQPWRRFLRHRASTGMLLAILVIASLDVGCARQPRPVRIVLITLDTLRLDAFREDAPPLMPRLRSFAARGQTFERFYAATPSTVPTHASLFTGLHPWDHGVTRNGAVLAESHRTIAEVLAEQGFDTGAVVASFPLDARFGLAQGFRVYRDAFSRSADIDVWEGHVVGGRFYRLGAEVTSAALRLLDELRGERQFLWVHYFDPHDPYGDVGGRGIELREILAAMAAGNGDAARRVRAASGLYRRDVARLDQAMGPLLDRLDADAARIETHVVVTADHGESLGERGVIGHGLHLAAEQIHVPTIIVSPRASPGKRRDLAGTVDLAAVLSSLGGAPDLGIGRDLLDPASPPPRWVFGMRRPFAEAGDYLRVDGTLARLARLRFYAAGETGVARGRGTDIEAPGVRGVADLPARFAGFERALGERPAAVLEDAATRAGLEALGYAE